MRKFFFGKIFVIIVLLVSLIHFCFTLFLLFRIQYSLFCLMSVQNIVYSSRSCFIGDVRLWPLAYIGHCWILFGKDGVMVGLPVADCWMTLWWSVAYDGEEIRLGLNEWTCGRILNSFSKHVTFIKALLNSPAISNGVVF